MHLRSENLNIEIDYNPTSKREVFFISVGLNKKEAISFDYTTKAHDIKKQVLIMKKKMPPNIKLDSEWDTIVIGKTKCKRYHVRWIDFGKFDWCNDEVWEIAWSKPMTKELKNKLLYYSQKICDNYKNPKLYKKDLTELEELLKTELKTIEK